MSASSWAPIEGTLEQVLDQEPRPFRALAEGTVPAVIQRKAFPEDQCRAILRRLKERGCIQERPGIAYDAVGTSLVNLGKDPEAFFAEAKKTHALYGHLFEGLIHPVDWVYRTLQALAPDRTVRVAREPDGRLYGPGIFRIYPAGKGHPPHFDSVARRERWSHYAASRFPHQFASVLCLQQSEDGSGTGEALIYRQQWSPGVQEVLQAGTFHAWAEERGIERVSIRLEAGDFYVFNPFHIHEVPYIAGNVPRAVLANFLGYSPEEEVVDVWS
jgi:hypothetical protein